MEKPKESIEARLKNDIERLTSRVEELEAKLKESERREEATIAVAKDALRAGMATQRANDLLSARNKELENPDGRYNRGLGWLAKIIHILGRVGRPMRAAELRHEIGSMDGGFRGVANPETLLSVVLTKGVKDKRLLLFKVAGTRGGYYALQEWIDESGKLLPEQAKKLL